MSSLASFLIVLCVAFRDLVVGMEEHGNAPDSRNSDEDINDSCEYGLRTARNKGYEVKLENTYKTPVERAYYRNYKCDFIC